MNKLSWRRKRAHHQSFAGGQTLRKGHWNEDTLSNSSQAMSGIRLELRARKHTERKRAGEYLSFRSATRALPRQHCHSTVMDLSMANLSISLCPCSHMSQAQFALFPSVEGAALSLKSAFKRGVGSLVYIWLTATVGHVWTVWTSRVEVSCTHLDYCIKDFLDSANKSEGTECTSNHWSLLLIQDHRIIKWFGLEGTL